MDCRLCPVECTEGCWEQSPHSGGGQQDTKDNVKHTKFCVWKNVNYQQLLTLFLVSLQVNFSSCLDVGSASGSSSGGPSHLPLVALSPIIHPRIREFRSGLGSSRKGGCGRVRLCGRFISSECRLHMFFIVFPQRCPPLRCPSTTGTAHRQPAVPNGVSLGTTLQARP